MKEDGWHKMECANVWDLHRRYSERGEEPVGSRPKLDIEGDEVEGANTD